MFPRNAALRLDRRVTGQLVEIVEVGRRPDRRAEGPPHREREPERREDCDRRARGDGLQKHARDQRAQRRDESGIVLRTLSTRPSSRSGVIASW